MSRLKVAAVPDRSNWADAMRAAFARASYREAAAIFDSFAGSAPPFESVLLRARIHLKRDEYSRVIRLLTGRKSSRAGEAGERAMLLAYAYAHTGKLAAADEFFKEAETTAARSRDRELLSEIAYYRARRYLFEGKTRQARTLLPEVRAAHAAALRLRATYLESTICARELRYREQAQLLTDVLQATKPQSGEHLELRAWATHTLAALARELPLAHADRVVEVQLAGHPWPPDFSVQRFQALKALGWCRALDGDYFNAFRFLKRSGEEAVGDAWRAVAACDRAYLARCNGEPLWSREELAEAEDRAARVDWQATQNEERIALLLLAELFAPLDTSKAAFYLAQYDELGDIKSRQLHYRDDPRPTAIAHYCSGIVQLATGKRRLGIESLKKSLKTFDEIGYCWRAGRCALRLYEVTRDGVYLETAIEKLRRYPNSWLGKELGALSLRRTKLPPMQQRVYDAICRGLSNAAIAKELGRSEFTVRNHIKLIFKAFGVNSRSQLIANSTRDA
jgi:DNA-binding CsgD family transcriptional regulator